MPRKAAWPPRMVPHASGQAKVRYRGEDHYLGVFGSDEAVRNYDLLLARLAAQRAGDGSDGKAKPSPTIRGLTVGEALATWSAEELPRHTDQRQNHAYQRAVAVVVRLFGGTPVGSFKAAQLRLVRKAMVSGSWMTAQERGRHAKRYETPGWCMSHVNQMIVRVRTVWRWLEGQGHAPDGSWSHLRTLPPLTPSGPDSHGVRRTAKRRAPETAQVALVARRTAGRCGAMLLVQYWSGMRSGEVRRMRADEVDRSGTVWLYRPGRHKTTHLGHDRVVALGPRCQALLRARLAEMDAAGEAGLVFPTRRGKKYRGNSYAQAVGRAARAADLP